MGQARACSIAMLQLPKKAYVKHQTDDNKRREYIGRTRMNHTSKAVISNAIRELFEAMTVSAEQKAKDKVKENLRILLNRYGN